LRDTETTVEIRLNARRWVEGRGSSYRRCLGTGGAQPMIRITQTSTVDDIIVLWSVPSWDEYEFAMVYACVIPRSIV